MGVALEPEAFRSLALSRAFLIVRCAAGPLRASPRFRLTLPGSLDSGRSKQTVGYLLRSLFCSLVPRSSKQPQNVHNILHRCDHIIHRALLCLPL
jgi:hypothetical protein